MPQPGARYWSIRLWLTDAGRALRLPVERQRRLLEQALAASLTGEERAILVSALTKIHRAAAGILAAAGTAEAARDELSRTASW